MFFSLKKVHKKINILCTYKNGYGVAGENMPHVYCLHKFL